MKNSRPPGRSRFGPIVKRGRIADQEAVNLCIHTDLWQSMFSSKVARSRHNLKTMCLLDFLAQPVMQAAREDEGSTSQVSNPNVHHFCRTLSLLLRYCCCSAAAGVVCSLQVEAVMQAAANMLQSSGTAVFQPLQSCPVQQLQRCRCVQVHAAKGFGTVARKGFGILKRQDFWG